MQYQTLGQTDINVSRICLGTMTWGLQNDEAEGHRQMDYALERGVNFWDTAEMYAIPPVPETFGTTEAIIGSWFEKSGKRDAVVLATKISPVPWAREEQVPAINKQTIHQALEGSLKRLKTDYIDLYQLHWPTNRPNYHFDNHWRFQPAAGAAAKQQISDDILETLHTLDGLVKEGKIRSVGLSDDSAWGIKTFVDLADQHQLPRLASIQNEYNLLRRRDETDVLETCALEEVSYLPWSPLQMGVLSGKYQNGAMPEGARMSPDIMKDQADRFNSRLGPMVYPAVQRYLDVAERHGLDICQMAIAFTIRKPLYASTIIGATNMAQLKTNIDAVDLVLSDEVLADIEKVYRDYPVPF
jgi:aryl-alcohol dehydrogenase-like predicted oxidoreductase